jgi:2-polyprenyl-6-methoxyphenol hydroxylase-like FAD-dependent oxidoreductase
MAGDLSRHGLKCRIVDKLEQGSHLSRAVVVLPRTLEELRIRGIADNLIARGIKVPRFSAFAERQLILEFDYSRVSSPYPYILTAPQPETEGVLLEWAERMGARVEWETEALSFDDDGQRFHVGLRRSSGETETVHARWLLACDGCHSSVRHHYGIPFEGETYGDVWILGDVKADWHGGAEQACAFFDRKGYLAIFPMPEGRVRMFYAPRPAEEVGTEVTLEKLEAVANHASFVKMRLYDPRWLGEFRVHHRKVPTYRKGRAFLAGDAAHIHSPETGLGMNTGIQDAFNLAWKLALVHNGQAPESLLETYDIERNYVGGKVVSYSNLIHRVSQFSHPIAQSMRNHVFPVMSDFYAMHLASLEDTVELRIHYPRSAAVQQGKHPLLRAHPPVEAGTRVPHATLLDESGAQVTTYDLLAEGRHQLLLFSGAPMAPQAADQVAAIARVLERYEVEVVEIHAGDNDAPVPGGVGRRLLDPMLHVHRIFGAEPGAAILVRPDGYVGYVATPLNAAHVERYLSQCLLPRLQEVRV